MQSIHASKCRFHMLTPNQHVALVIPKQSAIPKRPDNRTTYLTSTYVSKDDDAFPILYATTSDAMLDHDTCQPLWTTVWTSYDIADMMGLPLVVVTKQYCDLDSKDVLCEAHMYRNRRTSKFNSVSSLYKHRRSII